MKGAALVLALLAGFLGCNPAARPESGAAKQKEEEGIVKTTQEGPVKATVTLSPKAPRLGDQLVLTLSVEAEPQVSVEMPPFGEALGRFSIVGFTPQKQHRAGRPPEASQRYLLEAPMSGRQRIPSLRVEFADHRPGQTQPDGGGDRTGRF